MNSITITQNTHIQLESADLLTASQPFYHANRTAGFHVLIYCISGNIYVAEDGIPYEIGPGELLLLKGGLHETPTKRIEKGTSWVYAHFYTKEVSPADMSVFDSIGAIPPIDLPKKVTGLGGTDTELLITRLVENLHSGSITGRLGLSGLLQEILLSAYEHDEPATGMDLAERISDFLTSRPGRALSTAELEEEFHLTYKYMEAVFKNKKGLSIMQYHTQVRITESARKLCSTDLSVAEIGRQCGFNDSLYFSRCFKKHMGLSPKAYRNNRLSF